MFCRNCASEVAPQAVICPQCGVNPKISKNYCQNCGNSTFSTDKVCVSCGSQLTVVGKDWLTTLILNITVGVFGVHRFYTGNIGIGIVQLLTAGMCGIWTLIDLIMIVTDNYRDGDGNRLDKGKF